MVETRHHRHSPPGAGDPRRLVLADMVVSERPPRDGGLLRSIGMRVLSICTGAVSLFCISASPTSAPSKQGRAASANWRDKDKLREIDAVPHSSGAVFRCRSGCLAFLPIELPSLRSSPFGIHHAPMAMAISPDLSSLWVIADGDANEYFLSGTFMVIGRRRMPARREHTRLAWDYCSVLLARHGGS